MEVLLLKTFVMLLCVGLGHAHWLRTLTDQRRPAASPQLELQSRGAAAGGEAQSEGSGSGSPLLLSLPPARSRRSAQDPRCALRSVLLQVRALGLGYDSDETVLFKYCSGTCPHHRSNHDLALSNLLQSGLLPAGGAPPAGPWHYAPCCRPTHHEDMAFLDNNHRWHKVEKLSAADCTCVG